VGNSFRRRAARQRVCDASNPTSHKPSNKLHVYILFLLFSFSCIINKLLTLFLYIAANQPITTPSFVNLCFLINYNLVQFKCYIYIYATILCCDHACQGRVALVTGGNSGIGRSVLRTVLN
jgi:hypothetical protein